MHLEEAQAHGDGHGHVDGEHRDDLVTDGEPRHTDQLTESDA